MISAQQGNVPTQPAPLYTVQVINSLDVPLYASLHGQGPTNQQIRPGSRMQYGSDYPFTALAIATPASSSHPPFKYDAALPQTSYNQGCYDVTQFAVHISETGNPPPKPGSAADQIATPPPFNLYVSNGAPSPSISSQATGTIPPGTANFSMSVPPSPQQWAPSGQGSTTQPSVPAGQQRMYLCAAYWQPDGGFNLTCQPYQQQAQYSGLRMGTAPIANNVNPHGR